MFKEKCWPVGTPVKINGQGRYELHNYLQYYEGKIFIVEYRIYAPWVNRGDGGCSAEKRLFDLAIDMDIWDYGL